MYKLELRWLDNFKLIDQNHTLLQLNLIDKI